MKKSTKATLLSVLLFPGTGHLYLKKYIPGILLSIGAAIALFSILSSAAQIALEVSETIQGGSQPLDVDAITALVLEKLRSGESAPGNALAAFLTLWVIGILDTIRVGRAH